MQTQRKALLFALAGSFQALPGCASAPTMKYAAYPSAGDPSGSDQQGSIKFYLYGSIVTLVDGSATPAPAPAPAAAGGSSPAPPDAATQAKALLKASTPVRIQDIRALKNRPAQAVVSKKTDTTTLYSLIPDETFYYKPNISVTYITNSYTIKSLGAAAEDNRVQIVNAIGGILTAAAPLLAADAAPQAGQSAPPADTSISLPIVIDLTPVDFSVSADGSCVFQSTGNDTVPAANWCPITGTGGTWEYVVKVKQLTPGMVGRKEFFDGAIASSVRMFPVPSCQAVKLSVRQKNATEAMDFDITVANPQRVATFLVPAKGSITPGDVCGADLTVTSSTSSTAFDIANAVATQAAAIQKAMKAADPTTNSAPKAATPAATPPKK